MLLRLLRIFLIDTSIVMMVLNTPYLLILDKIFLLYLWSMRVMIATCKLKILGSLLSIGDSSSIMMLVMMLLLIKLLLMSLVLWVLVHFLSYVNWHELIWFSFVEDLLGDWVTVLVECLFVDFMNEFNIFLCITCLMILLIASNLLFLFLSLLYAILSDILLINWTKLILLTNIFRISFQVRIILTLLLTLHIITNILNLLISTWHR